MEWITMSAACRLTGKQRQSIANPRERGEIPSKRNGGHHWLVGKEALLDYFRNKARVQILDGVADFCKCATLEQVEALLREVERAVREGCEG